MNRLFFDIETVAHEKAETFVDANIKTSDINNSQLKAICKKYELAVGGTKDALLDRIRLHQPAYDDLMDALDELAQETIDSELEKAPLDADLGQVVAIAWAAHSDAVIDCLIDQPEKEIIEQFWRLFSQHSGRTVGYNIIGFDLPFLMRRSMDLGIEIPMVPMLARYRVEPTTDLMMILYNWYGFKSLKFVAKRYGLDDPLPEREGSQVKDMTVEELEAYAKNGVDLVQQLFKKMEGVYFRLEDIRF